MTSRETEIDIDSTETREWLDSLDSVMEAQGHGRAHFLIEALIDRARRTGIHIPYQANTAYLNTIPTHMEKPSPGDHELEWRIRALVRWNAMAMVVRANRISTELGGHIASFASAATLYDVGFNHFWRASTSENNGDMIFIQGHSAPGIYARAYLEGRLNKEDLRLFRQEVDGKGLSSYPHPWLKPSRWTAPHRTAG